MEDQEQGTKSRVVKIDSMESWDFHLNQATAQGCPIVAHFTAVWCIPSVAMNPFMEELAYMYQNSISFLSIDVDEVKAFIFYLSQPDYLGLIGFSKAISYCSHECRMLAESATKEVASKYEVKAMPTFLLLKDGAPVDKVVGANPEEMRKRIQSLAHNPTDMA